MFLGTQDYSSNRIIPFSLNDRGGQRNSQQKQNHNIFANASFKLPSDTFERAYYKKSYKRLNDIDSNIMLGNLFQFMPSDHFRLELKIQKEEKEIKQVKKEIYELKSLGFDKFKNRIAQLELQKRQLQKNLSKDRSEYRQLGVVFKVADMFSVFMNELSDKLTRMKYYLKNTYLVRKIVNSIPILRKQDELNKLLVNMKTVNNVAGNFFVNSKHIPFGEEKTTFNYFSSVMTKANKYDAQTTKFLGLTQSNQIALTNPIRKQSRINPMLKNKNTVSKNKLLF